MSVRNFLFGAYLLLLVVMLTWPGYAWIGNRMEPTILGLPFSLAWNVGWALITFVVLTLYELSRHQEGES